MNASLPCPNADSNYDSLLFFETSTGLAREHWWNCTVAIASHLTAHHVNPGSYKCTDVDFFVQLYALTNNTNYSTAAQLCEAGTFGNETGLSSAGQCHACPPGTSCGVGATEPTDCSPGTYAANGLSAVCDPCPVTTFQPNFGAVECVICGDGYYCPEGSSVRRGWSTSARSTSCSNTCCDHACPSKPGSRP